MKRIITSLLVLSIFVLSLCGQTFKYLDDNYGLTGITSNNGIENPVTVSVIYDNYTKSEEKCISIPLI